MRCSCVSCIQRRGFNQPAPTFVVVPGGSSGGVAPPVKTPDQAFTNRGLNKDERLAKEREVRVQDEEIISLNPKFPYRVLAPDFIYFGVSGNPPSVDEAS
jgi:hypothetical protein